MNALNGTSHHALAVLATVLIGLSNLRAATFSDDNWTSMAGYAGANGPVNATAVDSSGNLSIGGDFTVVGEAPAYCLMGNHFHLVVETPLPNLVAGMKWFLGTYTSRFNRRVMRRSGRSLV